MCVLGWGGAQRPLQVLVTQTPPFIPLLGVLLPFHQGTDTGAALRCGGFRSRPLQGSRNVGKESQELFGFPVPRNVMFTLY